MRQLRKCFVVFTCSLVCIVLGTRLHVGPKYFEVSIRVLGVPVDILPDAPPFEESVYPYYPFHLNKDVLKRLLSERTVLVLPNVSGFQQTDGELIKAFVEIR